ncbi:MAG TPA: hypothetical protein G4N93_02375 [Dehalococcoidia bacterium]|nr:hypothetical protein [Dehalococcoidia bacterium]
MARSLNANGIASRTGKKWGATSIEKILHQDVRGSHDRLWDWGG